MAKYSIVYECEFKTLQEAAATAAEIAEKSAVLAPNIYMLLNCYAEKMMLTVDETDPYGGGMIEAGITALQELGYVEVGGECENDDYKMIWIVK